MRGRFAPSPSGRMHLGNVFSALLAWLSARSQDGEFLLRLEDLDERCQNPGASARLCEDLQWLGLTWDGDPMVQTSRTGVYEKALEVIGKRAQLYPCFCSRADLHAASAPHASDGTPIYAGTCRGLTTEEVMERSRNRKPALRVAVPYETVSFDDIHCGHVEQNLARECGDFVLRRSDGVFAYQLVVVVDDAALGIDEVVRGDDLLSSTPRQIWLQKLLGLPTPAYAHHPLLLAADGRRLSKREHDCDMGWIREHADSPEAVIGQLAAWAGLIMKPEPVAAEELVEEFNWSRVRKDPVILTAIPWT